MKLRRHLELRSDLESRIDEALRRDADGFGVGFDIEASASALAQSMAQRVERSVEAAEAVDLGPYPEASPLWPDLLGGAYEALGGRVHENTAEALAKAAFRACEGASRGQRTLFANDPDEEIDAIVRHCQRTWDGPDDLEPALRFAWARSLEATFPAFESHSLTDIAEAHMGSKFALSLLLDGMALARLAQEIPDYDASVGALVREARKLFPDAPKARPLGWKSAAKNYEEFGGMAEFDSRAALREFGGMDSGGAACGGFHVRCALPHVLYDDKEQGRKPFETLLGAVYGHAYVLNERNNSLAVAQDMAQIADRIAAGGRLEDEDASALRPHSRALLAMISKQTSDPAAAARKILAEGPPAPQGRSLAP